MLGRMLLLPYLLDFLDKTAIWLWVIVFALGLAVERLRPAERQPMADLKVNLGYALAINTVLYVALPLQTFLANRAGLGLIALPDAGWALAGSTAIYLLAVDFLEYLFHRAQHAWPLLWAMHSFHHSDPSVNITTTQRNFWLEPLIKMVFVYPVIAVLFDTPAPVLLIFAGLGALRFFSHMNLRLSLGPFWPVINGPQFHRIHHSRLPEHRDKNFAAFFPIFDILFGTQHAPRPGEFPPTGLDTGEAPRGVGAALIWPWRRRLDPARRAA